MILHCFKRQIISNVPNVRSCDGVDEDFSVVVSYVIKFHCRKEKNLDLSHHNFKLIVSTFVLGWLVDLVDSNFAEDKGHRFKEWHTNALNGKTVQTHQWVQVDLAVFYGRCEEPNMFKGQTGEVTSPTTGSRYRTKITEI